MFIGHIAVGFAAKRAAPNMPLGTLVFAALWLDLLWPFLLLAGIERVAIDPGNTALSPLRFVHYPYSHSLLAALLWSTLIAACIHFLRRDNRGALVTGAAVLSHWVLDWLVHRPDLPLAPGVDLFFGLGLWNNYQAGILTEAALFAAGIVLYSGATYARDRKGRTPFWSLVVFAVAVWAAGLLSPPPPGDRAVALGSLAAWLFVPWAAWIDRHRSMLR